MYTSFLQYLQCSYSSRTCFHTATCKKMISGEFQRSNKPQFFSKKENKNKNKYINKSFFLKKKEEIKKKV